VRLVFNKAGLIDKKLKKIDFGLGICEFGVKTIILKLIVLISLNEHNISAVA
jgi:hypothetical protein